MMYFLDKIGYWKGSREQTLGEILVVIFIFFGYFKEKGFKYKKDGRRILGLRL